MSLADMGPKQGELFSKFDFFIESSEMFLLCGSESYLKTDKYEQHIVTLPQKYIFKI